MIDRQTFQNKDLVLEVSSNYDPKKFNPNKYEAFLDALCENREYQKGLKLKQDKEIKW